MGRKITVAHSYGTKTIEIPKGYRKVTKGFIQKGDLAFDYWGIDPGFIPATTTGLLKEKSTVKGWTLIIRPVQYITNPLTGRQVALPDGYRCVTRGFLRKEDLWYNDITRKWMPVSKFPGFPKKSSLCRHYDLVCRKK